MDRREALASVEYVFDRLNSPGQDSLASVRMIAGVVQVGREVAGYDFSDIIDTGSTQPWVFYDSVAFAKYLHDSGADRETWGRFVLAVAYAHTCGYEKVTGDFRSASVAYAYMLRDVLRAGKIADSAAALCAADARICEARSASAQWGATHPRELARMAELVDAIWASDVSDKL